MNGERVVLTLNDKCETIKRITIGVSAVDLSKVYNVGKLTIEYAFIYPGVRSNSVQIIEAHLGIQITEVWQRVSFT